MNRLTRSVALSLALFSGLIAAGCGGGSAGDDSTSPPITGGDAGQVGAGAAAGVTVGGSMGAAGSSAGAVGSAGSSAGGSAGLGGAASAGEGGSAGSAGADHGASAPYTCNLILGIQTTSEWFGKFEKIADNDRWELMSQDSAHIEKWADPASALWSLAKKSPCVNNAEAPDRIVFSATNYDFTTVDEFLPKYLAVLNNIQAKYPSAKRIDLMTYTRAPNNMECVGADRSADSYIKPAQDQAAAQAAAMFPGLVFTAPKWEVAACADFTLCPHLTNDGNVAISATLAAYFDAK